MQFTPAIQQETASVRARLGTQYSDVAWEGIAPYIVEINRLKKERNAVILAHNYMTPDIFFGVADIVGDSFKLAVEAESLAGQKLLHIDTRKKLLAQFEALFGFRGIFEVIPKSELAEAPQETLLETKQKIKAQEREDLRVLLENHPLTREALSEFDGTIESIEVQ